MFSPRLRSLIDRANTFASQFYTPREWRALIIFLLLGIGVLVFRFGASVYRNTFSSQGPSVERIDARKQDSLYFALTRIAAQRDSLFFSLPEDSLLPSSIRNRQNGHRKEDGLRLGSISLNHGTKEDFVRLPSVGPVSAERILEYRTERGRFRSVAELTNVRGFGRVRFDRLKRFLRLE